MNDVYYPNSDEELNDEKDNNSSDIDPVKVAGGIGLIVTLIAFVNEKWKNHKLKKMNKLYQEALRKHQAEIDILKNDKEREEYKERLWEELQKKSEE